MLCPECRRMVGKDGYCPRGHLARPELQMQPPKAAPPPLSAAPAVPAAPPAAGVPSGDTPALPPLPPEQLFGAKSRRSGRTTALIVSIVVVAVAIFAFFFLGNSAGASNLKVVFTPGETHTYALEMTMKGKGGNLQGGFSTSISLGADLTQTTGAVDKDGNATINYTLKNFHYSEDGRHTIPPGAGAAFSVRMRPDGTIIGLEGGDPFGLEDISPAGQFVNPSNAGPLLPKTKVTPGESWTVTAKESLPDLGTIKATAVNTLLERRKIDGNDAAVIHSIVNVPLNLRLGHDELVNQARNDGEDGGDIPGNAAISMIGNMKFNLTQTIFTANGLLQSALGDGDMRGTMTIEGLPTGALSLVYDLEFHITMQKTSTGKSA